MTDCQVCCEPFNKMTRFPVQCINQCDLKVCRKCVDTYIVSNSPQEPSCMTCKHVWTEDFLATQMTKSFMTKKLKPLLAQRLFEVEQMRFPETQENLVRKREIARIEPLCKSARNDYHKACSRIKSLVRTDDITMETIGPDIVANAWEDKRESFKSWNTFTNELENLGKKSNKHISEYHMGCMRENCRGFLNGNWVCGICDLKSCKDCHEPFDDGHECDPGKIETVKLLKKDSKQCPKCSCFITKITGCDHMWCTNCNTGFSWRTGQQIDNSRQTNALYYQYMRDTQGQVPRNAGDIPICEQEIRATSISAYIKTMNSFHGPVTEADANGLRRQHMNIYGVLPNPPVQSRSGSIHFANYQIACEKLWAYVQVYMHIQRLELGHGIFNGNPSDNVTLREQFLTGAIDKPKFMSSLTRESTRHKKHVNNYNVLHNWTTVIGENLRSLIASDTRLELSKLNAFEGSILDSKLADMDRITTFTNEQFTKHNVKCMITERFYPDTAWMNSAGGVSYGTLIPVYFENTKNNQSRFSPVLFWPYGPDGPTHPVLRQRRGYNYGTEERRLYY